MFTNFKFIFRGRIFLENYKECYGGYVRKLEGLHEVLGLKEVRCLINVVCLF